MPTWDSAWSSMSLPSVACRARRTSLHGFGPDVRRVRKATSSSHATFKRKATLWGRGRGSVATINPTAGSRVSSRRLACCRSCAPVAGSLGWLAAWPDDWRPVNPAAMEVVVGPWSAVEGARRAPAGDELCPGSGFPGGREPTGGRTVSGTKLSCHLPPRGRGVPVWSRNSSWAWERCATHAALKVVVRSVR